MASNGLPTSQMPFAYRSLDHNADERRVLVLEANEDFSAPLRCRMHHVNYGMNSNNYIDYYALSYAWGEPGITGSIEIYYQGDDSTRRLSTYENLDRALRRIRANFTAKPNSFGGLWKREYERSRGLLPLWVDAICIDQNNYRERGQQVQRMGEIYTQAAGCLIWLGNLEDQKPHEPLMEFFYADENDSASMHSSTEERLIAMKSLLQASWFSRRWCIQEVLKSAWGRMHILFGNQTIHFERWESRLSRAGFLRSAGAFQFSPKHEVVFRSLFENLQRFDGFKCKDDRDIVNAMLSISEDRVIADDPIVSDYSITANEFYFSLANQYCTVDFLMPLLICATTRKMKRNNLQADVGEFAILDA